jgi:hypothetical protein
LILDEYSLTQKVYPAPGERLLEVVAKGFPQVFEPVVGAACPAVPVNLASGPEQLQIFLALETFHRIFFPWVPVIFFSEKFYLVRPYASSADGWQ